MKKRYICFTCYSFHPEKRGVSEEEFKNGDNVCKEKKCKRKGEILDAAMFCSVCDKMLPYAKKHKHNQ